MRLSKEKKDEILNCYNENIPLNEILDKYKISRATYYRIVKDKSNIDKSNNNTIIDIDEINNNDINNYISDNDNEDIDNEENDNDEIDNRIILIKNNLKMN